MNLILKKIDVKNGFINIQFEYENDGIPKIEITDSLKVGIVNSKKKVDIVFEDIIPTFADNSLTFKLGDKVRDLFLSTGLDLGQLYLESTKECVDDNLYNNKEAKEDNKYISNRYFFKHSKLTETYFCNFSSIMRLYFSRIGILTIDAKRIVKARNEEFVFLNEDSFSINNGELLINVPFQEDTIDKCEIVFARVSDFNNMYMDIMENYLARYTVDIDNGRIKVNLNNLIDSGFIVSNVWFSIQILIYKKNQNEKIRVLLRRKTYNNGYALYDLRKREFQLNIIADLEGPVILQSESNIGLIFALNDKSFMRYPLCSARLVESQLDGDRIVLSIQNIDNMGQFKGIVIEDSLKEKTIVEYDTFINDLMQVSININSFDVGLFHREYRIYVLSEKDKYDWMIPVVIKDIDEKNFNEIQFLNDKGCQYNLNIGVQNELLIKSPSLETFGLDNRIEKQFESKNLQDWEIFPKSKGAFYVNTEISEDGLILHPIDTFIFKYIKDIKVIIYSSKVKRNNDFKVIDEIEKKVDGFKFRIGQDVLEYIFENNGRFYIYLSTDYYEYFMPLVGINKRHVINPKSFFDRRNYFFKPVNVYYDKNIEYTIQPYYSYEGFLSIRHVRTEDLFKSQMSAQIEDVSIKDGILKVDAKVNKIDVGQYSGVCIKYRNRVEEDAVKIISRDISIEEDAEFLKITAYMDLTELPVIGISWDIQIVYTIDGKDYFLNLFQKDNLLCLKFRDPYNKDEHIYDDGTIIFPYCTYGNSVALLRREYYEKYDSVEFRLQEVKAIEEYNEKKEYYDSQNIVLIFEKFGTCSDNAYHLFRYCMENECEKNINAHIYYIIEKDSVDYKNVSMYEEHLVEFGSILHQIYLLAAKLYISSDTNANAYILRSKESYITKEAKSKKYLFIDHGIAALKNGSYIYGKGTQGEPTWYTVASDFQKELIKKFYKLSDNQLEVTGLARWDALEDKSDGKRKILIAPTWRRSLDGVSDEKFLQSAFCKNYLELLSSPRFNKMLEDYDLECDFYMHLKFIDYLDTIKKDNSDKQISSRINICSYGEKCINDFYMECSMMITDYSSVAFDTLWQNKPVVFYQFDLDEFDEMWGSMLDLNNELPGDLVDNLNGLLDIIEDCVVNDFCIKKCFADRAAKFFKYKDHNNCARIWKVVEKNWKKVL